MKQTGLKLLSIFIFILSFPTLSESAGPYINEGDPSIWAVPDDIPVDVEFIFISNNNISGDVTFNASYVTIIKLYMDENDLTDIPDMCYSAGTFIHLNLWRNSIATMDSVIDYTELYTLHWLS